METQVDLRLLAATYTYENSPIVLLYGKTAEGQPYEVQCRGFEPYFHIADPDPALLRHLRRDPEVLQVEPIRLTTSRGPEDCAQIVITKPWLTPSFRDRVKAWSKKKGRNEVLAADIPFAHRFIYDMDIGSTVRVEGTVAPIRRQFPPDSHMSGGVRAAYPTKEINENLWSIKASGFSDAPSFLPPLSILSFDIEASIKEGNIFVICTVFQDGEGNRETVSFSKEDEADTLREFAEYVFKKDPDIITGYNTSGYDWPKLDERARKNGVALPMGRDRTEPRALGGTKHAAGIRQLWRLNGRVLVDAWWEVRKRAREFGSKFHPVQETLDFVAKELLGVGKADIDASHIDQEWLDRPAKVIEYCKIDAELALDVLLKLNVIRRYWDMAEITRLPLDEVVNGRASLMVDAVLIRRADRAGVAVPLNKRGEPQKIKGAYVHPIAPGLHHNVITLDVSAMYPSIVIQYNLCFTTLDPKGEIETPLGHRFLGEPEGILPALLRELREGRETYKEKARQAGDDKELRDYYEGLVGALKVVQNSVYGVMGASFYRFHRTEVAESITAYGRREVQRIIKGVQDGGYSVIFGDTDSVGFLSPFRDLGPTLSLAEDTAAKFTEGDIHLGVDKIYASFFSHGKKKRYAGKTIWPYEDMIVKGYELRRTDSFPLLVRGQRHLFNLLLEQGSAEAVEYARSLVDTVRTAAPEDLIVSRSVRPFHEYKNPERMAGVQAAEKARAAGYEFVPGMKIGWIVTDGSRVPQQVEPRLPGRDFDKAPDYKYYAKRMAHSLGRVVGLFGWDGPALLMGSNQTTFQDWD